MDSGSNQQLYASDSVEAQQLLDALHGRGDARLDQLLANKPGLATAWFGTVAEARSSLHLLTDYPANLPLAADHIGLLVAHGADPNARFRGTHRETPLHWAASANDTPAIEALIGAGADREADGGVLTDGPPLDDAVSSSNGTRLRC
jgi:uncharacterized protein